MSTTTKTKRHTPRKSSHSKIISKKTRNTFKKNKHNTKCDNDFSDYYTSNDSTDYNQSSYYSTETETEYDSSHTSEYTSSDTEYDSSNSSHHKYITNSTKKIRNQKRGTKRKICQHRDESSTDNNSLHNRKMHKTHNKNNIIPPLPSPPIPISIASLPKQIFNVIPMPIDTELPQQPHQQIENNILNNVNISLDMCMLGVPKLIETNDNDNNHLDMNALLSTMPPIDIGMIKKRHDIYNDNHRNNSIGISKRMRNHINSISFEYYTNMPKEWYNPMECIIGIETGRLLNNNQQRLNYVYNVVNELLTDTVINNNIIEYPFIYEANNNNNNNNDEEYWKSLLDELKADNNTLQHIHNKMISEMILRQKDERINTLKRYHKPLLNEQFNDLIMNHKQYNIHKQRLHEKSWINYKLTNKQIKNELHYTKMLKKGPNPNQRNKERKYEVKKYYKYKKSEEKENKNMENENENELQTESENDIDEDKKRYDLDPNYNIKYEYIQDLNDMFDINKLTKGLPNGPHLMNIDSIY